MTLEAEPREQIIDQNLEKILKEKKSSLVLEDLFSLGYTTSDSIVLFENKDKDVKVEVVFRTLTPIEHRDIAETLNGFLHPEAQFITQKIETLARAIVRLNGMTLSLPAAIQEEYTEKLGRQLTPLDQARILMTTQIKSAFLVDALYNAYKEFLRSTEEALEDLKKK